jgi:hypothetical protein
MGENYLQYLYGLEHRLKNIVTEEIVAKANKDMRIRKVIGVTTYQRIY